MWRYVVSQASTSQPWGRRPTRPRCRRRPGHRHVGEVWREAGVGRKLAPDRVARLVEVPGHLEGEPPPGRRRQPGSRATWRGTHCNAALDTTTSARPDQSSIAPTWKRTPAADAAPIISGDESMPSTSASGQRCLRRPVGSRGRTRGRRPCRASRRRSARPVRRRADRARRRSAGSAAGPRPWTQPTHKNVSMSRFLTATLAGEGRGGRPGRGMAARAPRTRSRARWRC